MENKKFNPNRIKKLRADLNLTQEEFGQAIDSSIKKQHVSQWELDQVVPSTQSLLKISSKFNLPMDYFFGEDYNSSNNKD